MWSYGHRNPHGLAFGSRGRSCGGVANARDSLYVACLAGKRLYRSELRGDSLINARQFVVGTCKRLCGGGRDDFV